MLALASQLDPSPSPEWLSPSFYYTLSRAALTIEEIHVNTAIETVEAIGLQSLFLLGFDKHAIPERAWGMLGLAMRCALAVGSLSLFSLSLSLICWIDGTPSRLSTMGFTRRGWASG